MLTSLGPENNGTMANVDGLVHGYLAHKKQPPRRTLQKDHAWAHVVVLGEGAVSYEPGTPVPALSCFDIIEHIY